MPVRKTRERRKMLTFSVESERKLGRLMQQMDSRWQLMDVFIISLSLEEVTGKARAACEAEC